MHKQNGFTLLEVLLAVSITAMVGIGASQLLSSIVETKTVTESRAHNFRILQRADFWIKRDLWQVAGREVHNDFGSLSPELSNQGDYLIELTHSGLANHPFAQKPKSNMQRIAFQLYPLSSDECEFAISNNREEGDLYCLKRLIWPKLDNAESLEPKQQLLIDEVVEAQFQFRGQIIDPANPENSLRSNEWQDSWPPLYLPSGAIADLAQLKFKLTLPRLGEVERIYEVPRYAFQK